MAKTDLVLLHAPSVYDFREMPIAFGPVSDVVPSTQVFEMYPIGFLTLLAHLQKHGYRVRIINVALRMLRNKDFDVVKLIKRLKPAAFGIDLHWLVHAQGSLALAAIIKEHHPDTPVIFGGLSSSYYHEELINYPQVDYVLRGDSTEEPLRQLMAAIKGGTRPTSVPNLTWKDGDRVLVNDLTHVPADMNDVSFDYREIMKSSVRHLDLLGHLPFLTWLKYPIVAGLSCRGCVHNCVTCGGSASTFRAICARPSPAFRDPALLARDIGQIARYIQAPSITLGDLMQGGVDHARAFLLELEKQGITNHVALEFFVPPPREILELVARAVPNYDIQISPESHDPVVRKAFGRVYENEDLERFIGDALELGCKRLDLFFMIGLPKQTPESVRETLRYCRTLLTRFGQEHRLHPFISPLAPFLDPGSRAFEDPEQYGYHLFHRTLEEHRQALTAPSWKYTLNYETDWMTRDALVESTYEAGYELNRLKAEFGLEKREVTDAVEARIEHERDIVRRIDEALALDDQAERDRTVRQALLEFNSVGHYTLCRKDEMNWPTKLVRFHPFRILQGLLSRSS